MSYHILSPTAVEGANLGNAPALALGPSLRKTERTPLVADPQSLGAKRRRPRADVAAVSECARPHTGAGERQNVH